MAKQPLAYLYEEFDVKSGELKKSYLWSFHPNQLSYMNDLKNTTHHIKITPLFSGELKFTAIEPPKAA